MNENFMYGVGTLKYQGTKVGYVEKNSFDLGGKKPEAAKIEAEQKPGVPVLVIPQTNGTISPSFNMIQLNFESLKQFLGGELHKKADKIIGWTSPSSAMVMEGAWEIAMVSGQSILIPNATLLSDLGGKLTLTETAKIEVTLEISAPKVDKVPPYGIFASDSLPDEWSEENGWLLPKETDPKI